MAEEQLDPNLPFKVADRSKGAARLVPPAVLRLLLNLPKVAFALPIISHHARVSTKIACVFHSVSSPIFADRAHRIRVMDSPAC